MGKEGLVLKGDLVDTVFVPQRRHLVGDARGRKAGPTPCVYRRIGTKRTAKAAPLRRDVVDLAFLFQREVALDRNQRVIVPWILIQVAQRAGRTSACGARWPRGTTVPGQPAMAAPVASRSMISLKVSSPWPITATSTAGSRDALAGEQRRMPTAPNNRARRSLRLDRLRNGKSVVDRGAREHADAKADRIVRGLEHPLDRVRFEPAIDDDDLDL